MFGILKPASHISRLSIDKIKNNFPKIRWSVLHSTFIGYTCFYFVRNNLAPAQVSIREDLLYTNSQIGSIIAYSSIAYGLGKFLNGAISDRSNPRFFLALGLFLTAICNFLFGSFRDYNTHLFLWSLNGFFQSFGWAPCGRSLGHWFSLKERGKIFAIWNVSHNLGGGLIGVIASWSILSFGGWQYAFFVPGILAVFGAIHVLINLRDTPQSLGLPPIEEYEAAVISSNLKNRENTVELEKELSFKSILIDHVFCNRLLWLFAAANFFVYISRYAMLDWGPQYLKDVKGASLIEGGFTVFAIEFAGIPSTILMGVLSDKLSGRRGYVSLLCMLPVFLAFVTIVLNPVGKIWIDYFCLVIIGLFIYPPVMLLGVSGLDLSSKKAVGAAAGFIGLFGYLGRSFQAKVLGYFADQNQWNFGLYFIIFCTFISLVILAFTVKIKPKR